MREIKFRGRRISDGKWVYYLHNHMGNEKLPWEVVGNIHDNPELLR